MLPGRCKAIAASPLPRRCLRARSSSQEAGGRKDYAGPPLVSLAAEVADGLGLGLGDDITVNVLGREIAARIANLRKVDWRNLGINFVLVFSPNTFAGAPYCDLATLTFADAATGAWTRRWCATLRRPFLMS